jgi:hypothetical protein
MSLTAAASRLRVLDEPAEARAGEPAAQRLRPSRLIEGGAAIGRRNRLRYRAAGADGRERQTVELDGVWRLSPRHELSLEVHATRRQPRQTLFLKAALLEAEAHALAFAWEGRDRTDGLSQRLRLSGRWSADRLNRLTFLVDKAGAPDRLTLQGAWEIGKRHELLYRYQREGGRSGRRERTLVFHGAWDISRADRLAYRLEGAADSGFEFRAALQSPSLLARDGRIVYQVGIGASARPRRVAIFGAWKLHKGLSVSFEASDSGGRVRAVKFEAAAALSRRDRIAVALAGSDGRPLGLTVTFTRELFPDAGLFLRLRRDAEESSLIGGVQVRF